MKNLKDANQAENSRLVRSVLLLLSRKRTDQSHGFTLLEVLIVLVILGLLAAIAAPAWQAYLDRQRLNAARGEAMSALFEAKARAKQQRILYEVGFRQQGQKAQWAIYPVGANPLIQEWHNLQDGVQLDGPPGTTFTKKDEIYRVQFKHHGEVNGQLGRVTFSSTSGGKTKRCVIVTNLLGTLREGENRASQPDNVCS